MACRASTRTLGGVATLVATAVLVAAAAVPSFAGTMTLDECIETALTSSLSLARAEESLASAKAGVMAGWSGVLPRVSAGIGYTDGSTVAGGQAMDSESYTGSVSLSQTLLDGGTFANISGACRSRSASEFALDGVRRSVVLSTKAAYYGLLKAVKLRDVSHEALELAHRAKAERRPLSIGLRGNAADTHPELVERGFTPDIVTDQTSAHDELNGYVPGGMSYEEALELRARDPESYRELAWDSMARQVRAMLEFLESGSVVFDYGNNIRGQVKEHRGMDEAFDYPGFVPAYIRPLFCKGQGPFRWVALSGDPEDIYTTDRELMKLFPEKEHLKRWLKMAAEKVAFQGLPSRICWLGYGERDLAGLMFNDLVKSGQVKAPIVIGRDHLDAGSVASPFRETEGMKDGSDAIADWPILNALLNAVSGAAWVSVHHGGGVGMGLSIHAGLAVVADGTKQGEEKLSRCLRNDPGTGIARHVDAGYEIAVEKAKDAGLKIPMLGK